MAEVVGTSPHHPQPGGILALHPGNQVDSMMIQRTMLMRDFSFILSQNINSNLQLLKGENDGEVCVDKRVTNSASKLDSD